MTRLDLARPIATRATAFLFALTSALALALALGLAAPSAADEGEDQDGDDFPVDEVVIRVTSGTALAELLTEWNAIVLDSIPSRQMYLLHLNDPSLQDSMTLELDGTFESDYCDYNFKNESPEARRQVVVIAIGDSTVVLDQGAFTRIHVPEAQTITRGAGSTVALLDTGVDFAHPLLAPHLLPGFDFVDNDSDPADTANGLDDDGDGAIDEGTGHGTMVAGIIASIAPEATLLPLRVLDDEGRGSVFDILKGLFHAIDARVTVINLSLGMTATAEPIKDAIEEARDLGIFVAAAAGNDTSTTVAFPARDSKAMAITSTDSADVKASFANWSEDIDLCAPGLGIYSAYLNGGYGLGAGTSFSTPFVSATAALLQSLDPRATWREIQEALQDGAAPIDAVPGNEPFAGLLGAGRLDVLAALQQLQVSTDARGQTPATPRGDLHVHLVGGRSARGTLRLRIRPAQSEAFRLTLADVRGRVALRRDLGVIGEAHSSTTAIELSTGAGRPLAAGVYTWIVESTFSRRSGRVLVTR